MEIYFVYITCPTQIIANQIAECLLEKKVIACANIFPVDSIFSWNDTINKEKEFVLLVKTVDDHIEIIDHYIENLHPYTIPLISKIKTNVNEKFYNWVKNQINC